MRSLHAELASLRLGEGARASQLAATLLGEGRLIYVLNCSGLYVQQHAQNEAHLLL